jgi:phospholipid transport system substrate-binding protein
MTTVTSKTRIAFLSALAILAAIPAMVQAQASDPIARIGAYNDAIISVMKAKLGLAARAARFDPLVRANYDMPGIAALVVGPAWTTTSAEDKVATIAALTHHSAMSLARNFTSYDGTKFVVDPKAIDRASSKVVKVTIGSDVLYYRMRSTAGGYRIVDVISSGVSQVTLQRADLAGTVASGGAKALVRKLAQLDAS